jgi:hypothetical protein
MTPVCTLTVYFSNAIVIEMRIGLARALALKDHRAAIIPSDADLLEVTGVKGSVLVPTAIAFAIPKALVPPAAPTLNKPGLYQRDNGECAYCGRPVPLATATMDHIIPRSQGGETSWENLVLACRACNTRKADRTPKEARMKLLRKPAIPKVRLRQAG